MTQVIGKIEFKFPQSKHTINEIEEIFSKNPSIDVIDEDCFGNLYPRYTQTVSDEDYFEDIIISHWRPE